MAFIQRSEHRYNGNVIDAHLYPKGFILLATLIRLEDFVVHFINMIIIIMIIIIIIILLLLLLQNYSLHQM